MAECTEKWTQELPADLRGLDTNPERMLFRRRAVQLRRLLAKPERLESWQIAERMGLSYAELRTLARRCGLDLGVAARESQ